MTDDWLLTLDQIETDDLALVGGKAMTLAQLNRQRLQTPPGLVVTTSFFEAQINHFAYNPIWAGSPDVAVTESSLEFLADFLKTTPLAAELDAALKARLKEVFPAEMRSFAVRSSAIDEDQQDHSFAGAYLTELGVPRDLITISLTRCWASALAGKAIKYRLQRGMSIRSIRIAVLIQPMLRPQISGVGFTLNPITGARDELVIEAAEGLGEAIMGGSVTPYRYHLANRPPQYPLLKKIPGDVVNLIREPLATSQLTQLAQTLEQIEALMGRPQDVEWAYEDDKLYLLQARPITVIPKVSSVFFDTEWTRANHLDVLPDIPSPLFLSLVERTQDRGISFFHQLGIEILGIGPYMKSIYGRPYLNLSMIKRILTHFGFNSLSLLKVVGYVEARTTTTNPFSIDWEAFWRAKQSYLRLIVRLAKLGQTVSRYRDGIEQIITDLKSVADDPNEALSQFRLREQVYGELISTGLMLVSALTGLIVLIARIISPIAAEPDKVLARLASVWGNSAARYHSLILLRLGYLAKDDSKLADYLTRIHYSYKDYRTVLAGTQFLAEFEAYLADYGDRAVYEPDMSWPRYREQVALLLRTIGQYTRLAREGNLDVPGRAEVPIPQILQELIGPDKGLARWLPWRRLIALPLMALLRRLYVARDNMRAAEAKGMAAVRAWDLLLADRWIKKAFLERVDDYFWLTMEEIERAIVAGDDAALYLKPAIAARKEAFLAYSRIDMPVVLKDSNLPALHLSDVAVQEVLSGTLTGLPISPGQVQGIIKILEENDKLDQIPEGSILVTPSTDPAILAFFPLAAGLIVEVGGMLSHGSIIAREYGLPAVSNITDARKRLKSGDRVLLDGSTGVVQILEPVARQGAA